MAHMCHFSHKPHGKLCCGGEQLIYEDVIRSPRQSMAVSSRERRRLSKSSDVGRKSSSHSSERARRRCSNPRHIDNEPRRPSSVPPPASPTAQDHHDEDDGDDDGHIDRGLKRRTGSELSVSSLPSTTSPVEVFIARGALTDESGADSNFESGSQHSYAHFGPGNRVTGGFRSLVSCLVPNIKKSKSKRRHRRKRNHNLIQHEDEDLHDSKGNQSCPVHPPPPSVCSSGSRSQSYRHRGLSTTPEVDASVCSRSTDKSPCCQRSGDPPVGNGPNYINDKSNVFADKNNIDSRILESNPVSSDPIESIGVRRRNESGKEEKEVVQSSRKGHLTVNQVKNVDLFIPAQMVTPPSPQPLDQCKSSFSSSFLPSPLQDECPGSSSSSNKIIQEEEEGRREGSFPSTSSNMKHSKIESSTSKYRAIDPWTFENVPSSAPSTSSKPPAPQPPSLHHSMTGIGRELESRNVTRSPSDHSNCSSLFSPDPRRRKKGRAPRPPRSSVGSSTCSVGSNSLGSPATCNATDSNVLHSFTCHRKRRSFKNKPAPTPPPSKALLTRSMSEQRQLNVKNLLNADPSFRSVVDLGREARKGGVDGERIRRRVNTEKDSVKLTINYLEDGFEEDERVAIVALASDGHGSCFPIFDQVPCDLQQAMTQAVNEHDSRLPVSSFPNSLLISFSPQPASPSSSFRDASVQVSSLKVTDPLTTDSMKRADEDERGSERGVKDERNPYGSGDDDEEEEEEEEEGDEGREDDDESSTEGTVNFDCVQEEQSHPVKVLKL